ncbi:hypothetical protein [Echinicola vietnamensis]|uniref:Outer membrane protein n=1 Tax=Echinicola vietnamensis (strain DSM 17526 / LMG 23754 / KMM 6221) TaxID=926556 RepID=L0FV20_ECHVK|nr:hypothetical protein [Echinicola vietnamensis]AGA77749.1 hypothetical protein Echvi_1483 [Echinicola vietnamensis DSM 17526]
MLLVFLISLLSLSQQDTIKISSSAILATASEDPIYIHHTEQLDYIDKNTYKLSYVDHLELRTRTRNFNLNEQMLRFRAYTNFPKERKLNTTYKEESLNEGRLQGKEKLNNALKNRYKLIISLIKNQRVLRGKLELKDLLEDRISTLRKLANNLDFDYQELLEAENDLHKLRIDQVDLENNVLQSSKEIGRLLNIQGPIELEEKDLISVNDIMLFVKSYSGEIDNNNFYYKQQSLNVTLAELEYKQKKASAKNPIKFFEASYRDDLNDTFRKDFSVGMGIKIPIGSAVKGSLNERVIKIVKEKNELDELKFELNESIREIVLRLDVLFDKHRLLSTILKESNEQESLKKYRSIEGISPLVLLKVKENIIKKQQIRLDLEKEIFSLYLEFLDLNGLLIKSPLVNYLNSQQIYMNP